MGLNEFLDERRSEAVGVMWGIIDAVDCFTAESELLVQATVTALAPGSVTRIGMVNYDIDTEPMLPNEPRIKTPRKTKAILGLTILVDGLRNVAYGGMAYVTTNTLLAKYGAPNPEYLQNLF